MYIICKDVHGFKYYARFTDEIPFAYKQWKWQGLKNNATTFVVKTDAYMAAGRPELLEKEPISIINYEPRST